MEVKAEAQLL